MLGSETASEDGVASRLGQLGLRLTSRGLLTKKARGSTQRLILKTLSRLRV